MSKTPLYSFSTESHRPLLEEYFLPSFEKHLSSHFDHKHVNMSKPSGTYGSTNFRNLMIMRCEKICDIVQQNRGSTIATSDVDIQFFDDKVARLIGKDTMFVQDDLANTGTPQLRPNAGFTLMPCTHVVEQFWREVIGILSQGKYLCDRSVSIVGIPSNIGYALKYLTRQPSPTTFRLLMIEIYKKFILQRNRTFKQGIKIDFLPATFMTPGAIWLPGKNIHIPRGIQLHHANWTEGVENKMKQLAYVRERVRNGDYSK